MKEQATPTEIASLLRKIGTVEGCDTTLVYGGRVYELFDDGSVYRGNELISRSRSDVGKVRGPYRRNKAYEDHLVSDFNYDPGGDDSPDEGPIDY